MKGSDWIMHCLKDKRMKTSDMDSVSSSHRHISRVKIDASSEGTLYLVQGVNLQRL